MKYNCSNLLDMRNLQEQVKKAFCYQKLFWPFTIWINWPSDLKFFANSWPSASNFKSFSQSLEQCFLTVGQNNFGNKIPIVFFYSQSCINFIKLRNGKFGSPDLRGSLFRPNKVTMPHLKFWEKYEYWL